MDGARNKQNPHLPEVQLVRLMAYVGCICCVFPRFCEAVCALAGINVYADAVRRPPRACMCTSGIEPHA